MDETRLVRAQNVLLLIVDSLRPDHVGAYGSPQIKTPNIDALAARGRALQPRLPGGDGHDPGAPLDLHQQADLPVPPLEAQPGARHQPRVAADRRHRAHVHERVPPPRLLDGAGVGQPSPRLHERVRAVPAQLRPLEVDPRPGGHFQAGQQRAARDRLRMAAAVPARRPLRARGCGSTSPTRAQACARSETCAARVYEEAIDTLDAARLRQPFCMVVDCFDPHEPWSPSRST